MLKLKFQHFGNLMQRTDSLEKNSCWERVKAGIEGTTEEKMFGWHHRLNGHVSEQAPGDSEEQGSLACCSPWGRKKLDMTEQLYNNNLFYIY